MRADPARVVGGRTARPPTRHDPFHRCAAGGVAPNVEGALFSLGDGHYAQAKAKRAAGVAVEGAMSTTCVDVIKSAYVEWPRAEDDRFRIAYTQLARRLASDFGLSTIDAYQLVSQVAKTGVANVVDTNYTVLAKFPKRYLAQARPAMGGVHAKLRRIAANAARAFDFGER
jgi:acetamidase/formamidase